MPRIVSIDYGTKRVGIAVTDPLQIIANALTTVKTTELVSFLTNYFKTEEVESVVIGMPVNLQNQDTDNTAPVRNFILKFKTLFPSIPIQEIDERFTSKMALNTLIAAGTTKKFRRDKSNIDKVSATIILQDYLSQKR